MMRPASPRFLVLILSGMMLSGSLFMAPAAHAETEDTAVISSEMNAAATTEDSSTAEGAAAHADDHAGAEKIGFPQLKVDTYPKQVFWLFIAFILLFFSMSKLALPRVGRVIDSRNEKRASDLEQAQVLQKEAAKIKTAYDKALTEAQNQAQAALSSAEQAVNDKVNAENAVFADHARKRIVTAEQNISRAKNDALQSLADISAEIASEMANKIAGIQTTKADAKKAVVAAMQEGA